MSERPPFHLAFPVNDLAEARYFYGTVLGCPEGRSSDEWVDFDFHGHQIVAHLSPETVQARSNRVDGNDVPVRHFGLVLSMDAWQKISQRLKIAGAKFIIEPRVRFAGQAGEQATLFVLDPSGNALEFKAFKDSRRLFAK
ncbi:MAG: VOC family protein [Betaproteobacteria bacterium]|jgi:extradiol dioxygenase family protein|nr:MAG: VOC family protein [Betaproteobacteria bacterium]